MMAGTLLPVTYEKFKSIVSLIMTVTKVEIALLVLAYLKDEKYKETYDMFQKESANLLAKMTSQTVHNFLNIV
jgi:hypothetical protein